MAHPQHNFTSNFNGSEGNNAELTLNINGVEKTYTPAGNDQTYNVPGVARIDINLDGADLVQAIQTALDGAAQPVLAEMSIYDEEVVYQYIGDMAGCWHFGICTVDIIITLAVDKTDGSIGTREIPVANGVVIVPTDGLAIYSQLRSALALGQLPVLSYVGANPVYAQYEKTADNGDLVFVGAFATKSTSNRIQCVIYKVASDNTITTETYASFSGAYNDLTGKPSIPVDSGLVHKTGAETITGIKTFSNDVSPRQLGNTFSKQSKVFTCSVIKSYTEWSAAEQDNNHFRLWTINITSIVSVGSTHCNIVVKLMGSWYSTSGNGALQKEITCQIYNGTVVVLEEDYTVAQSPCADEFVISGVIKSDGRYLLQVTNRNPTANNYPLRLEIEVFNTNNAILDDVTLTESITEGLPAWAVDVPKVTANGSPVLTEATAATVAKTGSYNDLLNKPTIVNTNFVESIGTSGQRYLTSTEVTNKYADVTSILPVKFWSDYAMLHVSLHNIMLSNGTYEFPQTDLKYSVYVGNANNPTAVLIREIPLLGASDRDDMGRLIGDLTANETAYFVCTMLGQGYHFVCDRVTVRIDWSDNRTTFGLDTSSWFQMNGNRIFLTMPDDTSLWPPQN